VASPAVAPATPARPVAGSATALAVVLLLGLVARALVTLLPDLIVGNDGACYLIRLRAGIRPSRGRPRPVIERVES
jgi:hypothetical protein